MHTKQRSLNRRSNSDNTVNSSITDIFFYWPQNWLCGNTVPRVKVGGFESLHSGTSRSHQDWERWVFTGLLSCALTVQHQVQSSAGAVNPRHCQHGLSGEPCPCAGQDNLIPVPAMAYACLSSHVERPQEYLRETSPETTSKFPHSFDARWQERMCPWKPGWIRHTFTSQHWSRPLQCSFLQGHFDPHIKSHLSLLSPLHGQGAI